MPVLHHKLQGSPSGRKPSEASVPCRAVLRTETRRWTEAPAPAGLAPWASAGQASRACPTLGPRVTARAACRHPLPSAGKPAGHAAARGPCRCDLRCPGESHAVTDPPVSQPPPTAPAGLSPGQPPRSFRADLGHAQQKLTSVTSNGALIPKQTQNQRPEEAGRAMLTQGWRVARALPPPDAHCLTVPALQPGLQDRAVLWPRAEVAARHSAGRQLDG